MSCHILCAHSDKAVIKRLEKAIRELAGETLCVSDYESTADLLSAALSLRDAGEEVAMVFCDLSVAGSETGGLFRSIRAEPLLRGTRKILLDTAEDAAAVDALLQQGLMRARLDPDFQKIQLEQLLKSQLTDFVTNSAPHLIDELLSLLDLQLMAGALSTARKNFELLSERMGEVQRSVVGETPLPDAKVEDAMINEFDRILGSPERRCYAPGEELVRSGDEPGRIWIILYGRVKLIRTIEGEEVIFHSESAGRIVGLMSLSLQNPVAFTCRAVTEVKAIILTREQIRDAIQKSTILAQHFITVMMRTMARRNARAAELLTEVRTLNIKLARQRDDLADALKKLRATQRKLIDSAKMATLGNLAAGMAHELNNPVGAILRSTDHLEDDLLTLLKVAPELSTAADTIPLARQAPPLSTREERKLRKHLASELKIDPDEAGLLVAAGIQSKEQFEILAKTGTRSSGKKARENLIQEISRAGQVGASLRNLSNCSKRISELVRSLKVYARDEQEFASGIEVNQTLDDVLLILANKVKALDLQKEYGTLPTICASASQLQQVWTNLISNAVQALDGRGKIRLRSSAPNDGGVRIEIEDNGPGIPEEVREKLWDAHFTTRSGRIEFGLGLGLPIVQMIVRQHGGDVSFESKPGRTVFTVDLPVHPNRDQPA